MDARLEHERDVRDETVTLDDVLAATAGASLRVVILDACRDNPLARSMQRTRVRQSTRWGYLGELNEYLLGVETLVTYAAGPWTTAADGTGRNSPYTAALLAYVGEPLELTALFRRVRAQVASATNGEQHPHESQSLLGDHYLGGAPGLDPREFESALVSGRRGSGMSGFRMSHVWSSDRAPVRPVPGSRSHESLTWGGGSGIMSLPGEEDRRRTAPGAAGGWSSGGHSDDGLRCAGGRAVEAAMSIDSTFVRRAATSAAVVLLAAGLAAAPAAAQSARRVALVLGNSDYGHISRLPNPGNDAADMSAALLRLDFEVTTELDADRTELNDALRAFTLRSVGADVSLVFYAGHGMEMDGVNYLLPVDARLRYDTQVRYETVRLDDVLAATAGASLRIVILDACRDNALARSMQRTDPDRSISRGSLAALDEGQLGNETLVAYAAEAGKTVPDGRGRNSPYTSALLEYLEEPLELVTMFRRVRTRVLESTNGRQRTHEYQSLLGNHYLQTDRPPPDRLRADVVFWESIKDSSVRADFEAYLRQFPDGIFAELARNRVEALRVADDPAASDPPTVVSRRRRAGEVFRDCPTCPWLVVVSGGAVPDGLRVGQGLPGRRTVGARGGRVVVRAGGV